MNYQEARAFIDESVRYGGEVGLGKITKLLDYLGHPEQDLTFIHIAGTNGKGSVLSYVSTTLSLAGYKTGRYISPTLYSYEERFQIDGEAISKADFVMYMEQVILAVKEMEKDGYTCPSPFELETVLSFLYFRDKNCDFVVIECGLGGLEDATNVIQNTVVAVLTSISMDHMDYLGDTLGAIAKTKSGIIKPGCEVVSIYQNPQAMASILETCKETGCVCTCADYRKAKVITSKIDEQIFIYEQETWSLHLAGVCQIENAVTAIEVLKALVRKGYALSVQQMKAGISATKWNGRFTVIHKEPYFIVDGAHNPDAAAKFTASMQNYFADRCVIYIIGVFKDKQYEEVVRLTVPYASKIITVATPDNDRALPAQELKEVVSKYNKHVVCAKSLEKAVECAFECAGKDGVIASFGSLSFIGDITKIVENWRER